jgi:DNA-binding transcriptional ArsR family regulator
VTQVEAGYLDWALDGFSGYLAADELYDGPFCVLSAVDARQQRRLLYEVLDHDPTRTDILWFLARVQEAIATRGGVVRGITTDASPLYPLPIRLVFGAVPHQVCEFHILKELTKAVLHVLARVRKRLAAAAPALPRGRPKSTPEAQRRYRRAKAVRERVTELFDERHLFVRHHLSAAQRGTLRRLVRGQAQLRALRAIMDEVYRLFDRRCGIATALAKLARLRRRVRRYRSLGKHLDKLHSPNLEKALTFLDDKLLPATSNAVERGNRRYRKMQKGVYQVRTQAALVGRLALDLQRDQQRDGRSATINCLHEERGTP